MSTGMRYVIGVDGGGTKTLGLIMREDGEVFGRETFPSSNIHSTPHPTVQEVLQTLVVSLCARAGIDIEDLDAICLGMAGCDSPADRAILEGFLRPILSPRTQVTIVNDAIVAMRAVLGDLHGLLLIAGTGSICFGWNEIKGTKARCGGWGHLLSDEGSGYMIGLEGMRAILRGVDGRGPKTSLETVLLDHLRMKEPRDLLQFVYGVQGTKANIANLSRFVMQEEEKGDEACAMILDRQAAELVTLCAPVYHKLFEPADGQVSLGLWGGNLVHAENYRRRFLERLAESGLPLHPVMAPEADAVLGAARHALKNLQMV